MNDKRIWKMKNIIAKRESRQRIRLRYFKQLRQEYQAKQSKETESIHKSVIPLVIFVVASLMLILVLWLLLWMLGHILFDGVIWEPLIGR